MSFPVSSASSASSAAAVPFSVASRTDVGRVRTLNEDTVVVHAFGEGTVNPWGLDALVLVADGVGGHNAGEVASGLAGQMVQATFVNGHDDGVPPPMAPLNGPELLACVGQVIGAIHQRVWQEGGGDGVVNRARPATTFTLCLLRAGEYFIGHVGDSRAYLIRAHSMGDAEQITDDDSLVAEAVRRGHMSEQEARQSNFRNQITKAIGVASQIEPALLHGSGEAGDVILLCSDGLSEYVTPVEMAQFVRMSHDMDEVCRNLIALANERGGHDNISVALARFGGSFLQATGLPALPIGPRVARKPPTRREPLSPSASLALAAAGEAASARVPLPTPVPLPVAAASAPLTAPLPSVSSVSPVVTPLPAPDNSPVLRGALIGIAALLSIIGGVFAAQHFRPSSPVTHVRPSPSAHPSANAAAPPVEKPIATVPETAPPAAVATPSPSPDATASAASVAEVPAPDALPAAADAAAPAAINGPVVSVELDEQNKGLRISCTTPGFFVRASHTDRHFPTQNADGSWFVALDDFAEVQAGLGKGDMVLAFDPNEETVAESQRNEKISGIVHAETLYRLHVNKKKTGTGKARAVFQVHVSDEKPGGNAPPQGDNANP